MKLFYKKTQLKKMKKIILSTLLLLTACAYSQDWKSNFDDAKSIATKENKNILLVFSGSDWCAPCIKLDRNVWQSDAFKKESEKWVLYKADFPKKKGNALAPELAESNKKLAEKYNKSGNFPLVLLLNPDGKVIGLEGFKNVSAEDYIAIINSFQK